MDVIPKIVTDVNDPRRASLAVALREEEYRKALIVRTVVNNAPELLSQEAIEEAESELKGEDPPEHYIIPMSEVLLDHLPSAYRRLAVKPLPWPRLQLILPLLAFLAGGLSNVLSPLGLEKIPGHPRTIHIFVNPIVMLILWNIMVVICFMVLHRRSTARSRDSASSSQSTVQLRWKGRKPAELDLPLWAQIVSRPLLRLWAMFVEPVAGGIVASTVHTRVAGLFLFRYFRAYRRPIIARVETIINVSAICLAAGAIAGMYIQAVVWDYSFFWKSTLVESPGSRLLIAKMLFWPAAVILGQSFPNLEAITAMAQDTGAPGAIWIHVFAITALVYIFLPRLALIYRSASKARRSSAATAISIDFICLREQEVSKHSGSYQPGEFLERPQNEFFRRQTVTLDYFSLDANAMSVLTSLQAAMIEQDIESTKADYYFSDDLTAKRIWYLEWLRLLQAGFANIPGEVRPALYPLDSNGFHSALSRLSQCSNPFVRELIVLELAAFEAYWPLTAEEKGWAQKMRDLTNLTPSLSKELVAQSLENVSHRLGLHKDKGSLLRSELQSVHRSLSGYWKSIAIMAGAGTVAGALTFGIAAPFIGVFIGHTMGLAGAAAVKAGLAAMGAGAIASGGMGIAGGTAVIFGGGALLGIGVAGAVAATMNPAGVLIQAVKIEVFLRCVVSEYENAKQVVRDVLCQLETSITSMDDELKSVRLNPNTDVRVSEREEIIKILRTCSERCAVWAKERGLLSPTD